VFNLTKNQIRKREKIANGLCVDCFNKKSEKSSRRCDSCLKKNRESKAKTQSTTFGRWYSNVASATNGVLRGNRTNTKILNWSHAEAVTVFGPGVKFYVEEGFFADHKIPLRCARQPCGSVDFEFAELATSTANIQLITKSANIIKGFNLDKEIISRAVILRQTGLYGYKLFDTLMQEFGNLLDYTDK
jgi:hypothetical protein